jgi:hypothetical protein
MRDHNDERRVAGEPHGVGAYPPKNVHQPALWDAVEAFELHSGPGV